MIGAFSYSFETPSFDVGAALPAVPDVPAPPAITFPSAEEYARQMAEEEIRRAAAQPFDLVSFGGGPTGSNVLSIWRAVNTPKSATFDASRGPSFGGGGGSAPAPAPAPRPATSSQTTYRGARPAPSSGPSTTTIAIVAAAALAVGGGAYLYLRKRRR